MDFHLYFGGIQAEINYLGQLHHPNLVKLIGYCLEDEHRLLVYEFMARGSMENHLFRSEYLILMKHSYLRSETYVSLYSVCLISFLEQRGRTSHRFLGASE